MIIKNITDQEGKAPKVIGVGKFWLMPGEEKPLPDDALFIDETDDYGRPTGRRIVLPAIERQREMGMLSYKEDKKAAEPAPEQAAEAAAQGRRSSRAAKNAQE